FSTLQSHISNSNVTLADGLTFCVIGSDTITPTLSIALSFVLHVPQLSFNLIFVSKLTRMLNYYILFFSNYCLFQDLMTKKIIGKGHEAGGLYILDTQMPNSITYSSITIPFKMHCQLGHSSLTSLKKLCPEFNMVSLLDCESCQFTKHHC